MEKKNELTKRELPTLADLNHDIEGAFKNDQLNILLNQPVPKQWIKDHPTASMEIEQPDGSKVRVPLKYIPIEKVEFLLTRIFQLWRAEIINYSVIFQSVAVHVRLHYLNPVTGKWSFQDGLGAVGVQTDKGKSAADLSAIKSDSVMKALPAAESYAIKDAAEKLGVLFGKNLNRKDTIAFVGTYDKASDEQIRYILELLHTSTFDQEQRDNIELETAVMNPERASQVIANLKDNQLDPVQHRGSYSQKELNQNLKERV